MMGQSLLLCISLLLSGASCQQAEFDFLFTRSNIPASWNFLNFTCENANGPISSPLFFRGTERVEVPNPSSFLVDRSLEGNYTCGTENGFGRSTSQPPRTIIARPDPRTQPSDVRTFFSEVGSTARLDCSITPGVAIQQYFVTWRSTNGTFFYESFAPSLNKDPFVLDPGRYFIDSQNFSLFINDVTLADEIEQYLCILSVEDPIVMQSFDYATENIHLSLSIFSAPQFIETPSNQIVTNGTDVEFSCSVVSSPEPSLINWVHRGSVVQRGDEKYTINTITHTRMEGGRVTESRLTIFDVTGFDSSTVECVAKYFADRVATVTATATSKAVLGVLDEVSDFDPIPLQTGGFIFKVTLKEPLLVPITLRFIYTEVGTGQVDETRSTNTFFNSSPINYIAFREEVVFDEFHVAIALEHEEISGPFFSNDVVYKRAGIPTRVLILVIFVSFLGLFFLLFLLFIIIVLCLWFRSNKALRAQLRNLTNVSFKQSNMNNCYCCNSGGVRVKSDGQDAEISQNGFTKELAESYVDSIMQSIKFAKNDELISKVLIKRGVATLPADDSNAHTISKQNQELPPSLVIEGTVPTSAAARGTEASNLFMSGNLDSKI